MLGLELIHVIKLAKEAPGDAMERHLPLLRLV